MFTQNNKVDELAKSTQRFPNWESNFQKMLLYITISSNDRVSESREFWIDNFNFDPSTLRHSHSFQLASDPFLIPSCSSNTWQRDAFHFTYMKCVSATCIQQRWFDWHYMSEFGWCNALLLNWNDLLSLHLFNIIYNATLNQ